MSKGLESLGGAVLTVALLGLFIAGVAAFLLGVDWLVSAVLPWLVLASWLVFVVDVVVLLPLALLRSARPWVAQLLFASSYLFGFTTWLAAFAYTNLIWGWGAVAVGVLLAGIGLVPLAIAATALKGMWSVSASLVAFTLVTYVVRFIAARLAIRAEAASDYQSV